MRAGEVVVVVAGGRTCCLARPCSSSETKSWNVSRAPNISVRRTANAMSSNETKGIDASKAADKSVIRSEC